MYVQTPLIRSEYFPQDVLLKLENTQPSGSFKSRGITALVDASVANNRSCHVYSSSGGNAGLAAAEAAKGAGVKCTVVVPQTTSQRMKDRITKVGAEVIVHGAMWSEADAYMQQLMSSAKDQGVAPVYCHPFDNPIIWEGHSTLVDEIVTQIKSYGADKPGAIVLSCGGGGLYLGVMKGLERAGWADDVPVVVVETEGAPTLYRSIEAGAPIKLDKVKTVATSLGSSYVPQSAVDYVLKYKSEPVLVTDEDCVSASERFMSEHLTIVEPACGATLAAIYTGLTEKYASKGPVVAIVCGGTAWVPQSLTQG